MALNFPANPNDGDTYENYVWNATVGAWQTIEDPSSIGDIGDVTITSPSDGQALVYDNSTGNWINETPASTLPSLTDVTLTSSADGEVLKYNGTVWENSPVAINTDGNPGGRIFVGATDPSTAGYTLELGDIWIEQA